MPVTATDVVSAEDVRAILEERTQPMYQFRRAFRDHDATDLDGGTFVFPQAENTLRGDMTEVAENTDYPRATLSHEGITAEYTKDGFVVAITDEAVDDTPVDVILDITQEMALAAEHRLDSLAFQALDAAHNATTVEVDPAEGITYENIVDAHDVLDDALMNPTQYEVYLSSGGWHNLAKQDIFTQATSEGEGTIRGGVLDETLGTPVFRTNTGDLGDLEGFVVDTSMYGYESTRWDREVETERDFDTDADLYKVRHRKDFVSMKSEAAVKLVEETA